MTEYSRPATLDDLKLLLRLLNAHRLPRLLCMTARKLTSIDRGC